MQMLQIFSYCFVPQNGRLVTWLQAKNTVSGGGNNLTPLRRGVLCLFHDKGVRLLYTILYNPD